MTTMQRLDKEMADLREMQASLDGSITSLQRERDLYRDENQRLQLEVARLQLRVSELEAKQ